MASSEEIRELEAEIAQMELDAQLESLDTESDEKLLKAQEIAQLEQEIAAMEATDSITRYKEEDSFAEDALDVGGEFAQAAHRTAAQTVDLFTSPVRLASQYILPEPIQSLESRLTEAGMLGNDYMDEGTGRDIVRGAGGVVPAALGFVPITRATGAASSVAADIAGLGMSVDDVSVASLKATQAAIKASDDVQLAVPKTDGEIWTAVKDSAKRQMVEGNRPKFAEAEKHIDELAGLDTAAKKKGPITPPTHSMDEAPLEPVNTVNLGRVVQDLVDRGVDGTKTLKVIAKKGGIRFPDELEMDDLIAMDKHFGKGDGKGTMLGKSGWWLDRTFTPVANMIGKYGDSKVGAAYERASESAMRSGTAIIQKYGNPLKNVIKAVDHNPMLQDLLLDMHHSPKNIHKFRTWISDNLKPKDLKAFNEFVKFSDARGAVANRTVYKGMKSSDLNYFHANMGAPPKITFADYLPRFGKSDQSAVSVVQQRNRPPSSAMDRADYDRYDNVLVSHMKHLAEQEQLIELQKHLHLRPSIGKQDTFTAFFKEVEAKMIRDGMSADKADAIQEIMRQAHEGSRQSPPPFIRAFMSSAYAGTLAQLKTSALNFHDIPVAMHTQGFKPTMRALIQSNKGTFGKSLKDLGIGDAQSTGEFLNQFDALVAKPSPMEHVATGARKVTEGSMFISAFKEADKIGKGVVLRAAVNRMRASASKGTLHKDFGELADRSELHKIRKYLADGVEAKDMPPEAARIVEELAFTQLGKQQLISQAGRPLNYLTNPSLRPLWALTGFAVKQRAMVAKELGEAVGPAAKAKVLASYSMYAGIGYGALNETRNAAFKNEDFEPEDILLGAVDQVAAMATINKLGDEYSRGEFWEDPVTYMMEMWLPPTGLLGAAGKSTTSAVDALLFDGEWDDAIVEKMPLLGDFYKYYWKDE